jgi:hypothetical protein
MHDCTGLVMRAPHDEVVWVEAFEQFFSEHPLR